MPFLAKLAAFVVLIGILVFVHELGHFLAAKFFRVKVLQFSVGFGPRLWGFRRGETEYQVAALPLGGYVRMAGEDPRQAVAPEDKGRGFSEQPPYRRAVIAAAGPIVNLILPPLVFAIVNLMPQTEIPAVVGVALPGEPAERAGLTSGDRIVSVDGEPIQSFEQLRAAIEARPASAVELGVERGGEKLTMRLTTVSEDEENPIETVKKGKIGIVAGKLPSYIGVRPGSRAHEAGLRTFDRVTAINGRKLTTANELRMALHSAEGQPVTFEVTRTDEPPAKGAPEQPGRALTIVVPPGESPLGLDAPDLYIRTVDEGSAAADAGLRPLDRIVALGGAPVTSGPRLERRAREVLKRNEPLTFTIERDGQPLEISYTPPIVHRNDPYLGDVEERQYGFAPHPKLFVSEPFRDDELVRVSYGPWAALKRGVETTITMSRGMLLGIKGLIVGTVPTQTIGGPIMLFQLAGAASERGVAEFLKMLALISINLGLVNLLPVPVLDGFHIITAGLEGISRRPLPIKAREFATYVGLAMVLALMLLAFYNDVVRTFVH